MNITDKRLLERMQTSTHRVDINSICNDLHDIEHKAETIEIDHEPIGLLQKAKFRKRNLQNKIIRHSAQKVIKNSDVEV